jgi:hypothetical protein
MIVILVSGSTGGFADVGQAAGGRTPTTDLSILQQRQYQQCLDAILQLQAEIRALSETPSRPEPAITIYARHRSPIRLAAVSARKCHADFVRSLSSGQRTSMKEALTRLSKSWSGIQRHLVTLDDDLYQHSLDNGRFALHVERFQRAIDDYLERYRTITRESTRLPTSSSTPSTRSALALRIGDNITAAPLTDCL